MHYDKSQMKRMILKTLISLDCVVLTVVLAVRDSLEMSIDGKSIYNLTIVFV